MKNNLLNAKILVSLKYSEKDQNFPLYVTAIMLLYDYYEEYKDIIIDIFTSTKIIIEDDLLSNILIKHGLEDYNKKDSIDDTKCGISSPGFALTRNNDNYKVIKDNSYIAINSSCGKTETLIVLIHELNHIIKSYFNSNRSIAKNKFFIRNGLSYTFIDVINGSIEYENYTEILDEVINTLETRDITARTKLLKDVIKDKQISEYIESLDEKTLDTEYGYENVLYLIKPLWENNTFKNIIRNNIIEGKLNIIMDEFNKYFENDEYNNLSYYIDEVFRLEIEDNDTEELELLKTKIKDIIKKYNKKTTKIYKK